MTHRSISIICIVLFSMSGCCVEHSNDNRLLNPKLIRAYKRIIAYENRIPTFSANETLRDRTLDENGYEYRNRRESDEMDREFDRLLGASHIEDLFGYRGATRKLVYNLQRRYGATSDTIRLMNPAVTTAEADASIAKYIREHPKMHLTKMARFYYGGLLGRSMTREAESKWFK